MRPLLLLPLLLLAVASPQPAHAGLGSLFRLASKAGKAAKVGKVATATKAVKVASAGAIGARVLSHADDPARIGLYVIDDGAGAFKVVTESGETLTETGTSLRTMVDDLEALSDVTPGGGVDLYVDVDSAAKFSDFAAGPSTRLWMVAEGAPVPLRQAAGKVEAKVHGHLWVDVGLEAAELGMHLSRQPTHADAVYVDVPGCTSVPAGAMPLTKLPKDGTVVVFANRAVEAMNHGTTVIHTMQPCREGQPTEALRDGVNRARGAVTLGGLWAAGATAALPGHLNRVHHIDESTYIEGERMKARTHPPKESPLPMLITVLVVLAVLGFKLRGLFARAEAG